MFGKNILGENIFGKNILGENIFDENIFGPTLLTAYLPLTYIPTHFHPLISDFWKWVLHNETNKLTDRTEHAMIVPFIYTDDAKINFYGGRVAIGEIW